VNDPPHVLLPGATRMPLIGLGTYKLESPEAVRKALEGELGVGGAGGWVTP
jgi:diketogulonate reductase-like aldo/keto reductase